MMILPCVHLYLISSLVCLMEETQWADSGRGEQEGSPSDTKCSQPCACGRLLPGSGDEGITRVPGAAGRHSTLQGEAGSRQAVLQAPTLPPTCQVLPASQTEVPEGQPPTAWHRACVPPGPPVQEEPSHLAGIGRYGAGHEPFQVTAKADALHRDNGFLGKNSSGTKTHSHCLT